MSAEREIRGQPACRFAHAGYRLRGLAKLAKMRILTH